MPHVPPCTRLLSQILDLWQWPSYWLLPLDFPSVEMRIEASLCPGNVARAWVSTSAKSVWHPQNFWTVMSDTRWFWQFYYIMLCCSLEFRGFTSDWHSLFQFPNSSTGCWSKIVETTSLGWKNNVMKLHKSTFVMSKPRRRRRRNRRHRFTRYGAPPRS